jgi:hypothetical protein
MSEQVLKAKKELNKITLLISDLIVVMGTLPKNSDVYNSATYLITNINNDKSIKAFVSKANQPGFEALASELAIRVVTKAKKYEANLKNMIEELKLAKARNMNRQVTGMGFSFTDWFSDSTSDRELGLSLLRAYYDEAKV